MTYRKKPDELPDYHARPVLDAMGRCRKVLIEAGFQVRPFGPAFRALHLVVAAIDKLAAALTGSDSYYAAGPSTPAPGRKRWEDSGS